MVMVLCLIGSLGFGEPIDKNISTIELYDIITDNIALADSIIATYKSQTKYNNDIGFGQGINNFKYMGRGIYWDDRPYGGIRLYAVDEVLSFELEIDCGDPETAQIIANRAIDIISLCSFASPVWEQGTPRWRGPIIRRSSPGKMTISTEIISIWLTVGTQEENTDDCLYITIGGTKYWSFSIQ